MEYLVIDFPNPVRCHLTLVVQFVKTVAKVAFKLLVENKRAFFKMKLMVEKESLFKNYLEALYATDVTFEQCKRLTGLLEDTRMFYGGKNHFYGYETKVSVSLNEIAIKMSTFYPGSVFGIEIFRKTKDWHVDCSREERTEIGFQVKRN